MNCSALYKLGFEGELFKMAVEKRKPVEFYESENDKAPKLCVSISHFSYET